MFDHNSPLDGRTQPVAQDGLGDVDRFGLPLNQFGHYSPPEFFEIVGRIVATNGRIEYLKDRLAHLPSSETSGVKKVEQFLTRYKSGRLERNAIVHSSWVFGAGTDAPDLILGVRYRTRKDTVGDTATVSIADVPASEKKQDVVQYGLAGLRKLFKRDITTLQVGEIAYTQVMLAWARDQ